MKIKRKEIYFCVVGFIVGALITYALMLQKVNYQKGLTKRILSNAVQSMQSSKEIADTCTSAYNAATACVANLKTCNIEAETKRLDEFNTRRQHAEQQINGMGEDMRKIIEEVKASH